MSSVLKILVIVLLTCIASCDRVPPPANRVKAATFPVTSFLKDLPPAKDEPIPEPQFVDFKTLKFQTPQVLATVLKWEELIKKYKRSEDVHVAWNKLTPLSAFPPVRRNYCEFWSNLPTLIDPEKPYIRSLLAADEIRLLRIECALSENQTAYPDTAWVHAEHYSRTGWRVRFRHEESARWDVVYSQLEFDVVPFILPGTLRPRKFVRFDFLPGQFAWRHECSFEGHNYHFFIALPEAAGHPKAKRFVKIKPRLGNLCKSADSFRQTCHAVADELEGHMREQFSPANGTLGIFTRGEVALVNEEDLDPLPIQAQQPGQPGSTAKQQTNKPARRSMKPEDWQSVLNAGLIEIAKRRQVIDDHYIELHEALVDLLPVHEFYLNVD